MNRFRTPVFYSFVIVLATLWHSLSYSQPVPDQIAKSLKLIEIGNPKQALANLQLLASSNPKNADAQAAYAIALMETGKPLADADKALQTAYDIEHKSVLVRRGRGMLFGKQGKKDDAVKEFRQAIKIDDKNVSSYLALARYYLSVDSTKAAEITLYQAQAVNANDVNSYIGLAELYERQHATSLAIEQYQSAEKLDPKDVTVMAKLAGLYFRNRKWEESVKEWIKVINVDSAYSRAYYEIANIFFLARQYANAATYAERYTRFEPNDIDGQWLAGRAFAESNQYQKALPYIEKAATDDSLRSAAQLYLARGYFFSKEFNKADSIFTAQKYLGPNDLYFWGYAMISSGDTTRGIEKWRQSLAGDTIRTKEEKVKVYQQIISYLSAQHNWADAAQTYVDMNTVDPSNDNYVNAGQLFILGKSYEKAKDAFNHVLQADQKNVSALVGLADIAINDDATIPDAEKYIDNAAEFATGQKAREVVGEAYARLGIKYYTLKNFEKCVTMLETGRSQKYLEANSPYLINVYKVLGVGYVQLKKFDKAQENYKKALAINPNDDDAKKGLKFLEQVKAKK